MSNLEKLRESFSQALNIENNDSIQGLVYQAIAQWDSISHMVLISQLEDDFGVSLETDDVIDMSSFEKAIEILKKYGIEF